MSRRRTGLGRLRLWTVGVVTALAASMLSGCDFDGAYDLPLPGSPVDEDHAIEVTADFRDILHVVPRSPVMVDDVTVGEVTEVERVGWHAKVTLRIREDVELPDNAVAVIRQVSLLGEKYVAVEPPVSGASKNPLEDGDHIPMSRTSRNPEVEEVLGALSFLLSGGGVGQLGTITEELNDVMDGRTDRLRHLLGSLEDVVGTLDAQKADIIRAMEAMNELTATLNRERRTIEDALDVTGPAVEVLADQHDELVRMLVSLQRLGRVGTRVITASKDDLIASLRHLEPVVRKLRAAGDKLAPGLNLLISFPFPKEASEIVKGDYANTSIRADISLENFVPQGGGLPGLPDLPTLDEVTACLRSADPNSKACQKVLRIPRLTSTLLEHCSERRYDHNPACRAVERPRGGPLPGVPQLPGGGPTGLDRFSLALTSSWSPPAPGTSDLYGGMS